MMATSNLTHENSSPKNTNLLVAGSGIIPTVKINSSSVKTPACDNYLLAEVSTDDAKPESGVL